MQTYTQKFTLTLVWITCIAIILASLTVVGAMLGLLPIAVSQQSPNVDYLNCNAAQHHYYEYLDLYEESDAHGVNVKNPWVKTVFTRASNYFVVKT